MMHLRHIPERRIVFAMAGIAVVGAALAAGPMLIAQEPPSPIAAVNATCPVMLGKPVDSEIFLDYDGRRIAFCCERCRSKFAAEPGKYLKNLTSEAVAHESPAAEPGAVAEPQAVSPTDHEAINAVLFATNADERFEFRRRIRLSLLPPAPPVPSPALRGFNEVDAFIGASWERAALPQATSPPLVCDDATFLRRVYLDVIGVIPTIAETRAFLDDASSDKRLRLIDALLARDSDYADHWSAFWEDALASSTVGVNAGMATRGNYRNWINESFRANKPFDRFAAELLDPTLPGHQPVSYGSDNGRPVRVHFVLNEAHTDTLQTAAAVAQVFMGTAMKCASCHNHFENPEWPQRRFLAFASMFGERDLEVIRCESRTGQFAAAAFPFEIPGAPTDMPATESERLTRASQLLVDPLNPRFARTIVNRLWKRYLGLGLFEPADDYRADVAVSQPELLDWLADDFMRHNYNMKRTIRLILSSRTYQTRFDPNLADTYDSATPGAPRYFRSPTLRRLTAEQLLDSIEVAVDQRLDRSSRAFRQVESTTLSRALGKPAVRNDVSTSRSEEPAILQGLELLNGGEYQGLTTQGRLVREAMHTESPAAAVNLLVLGALSRTPNTDEQELICSYIAPAWEPDGGSERGSIENVWIDEHAPADATLEGAWKWSEDADAASGNRSHSQASATEPRAQHLLRTRNAWNVGDNDVLIAYVFLDPDNPPREIMLQWNDGTNNDGGWAHRAYWGEDVIPFGTADTESRHRVGDLPEAGKWARLEVPVCDVGLGENLSRVTGISFDQAGGAVRWDRIGVTTMPESPLTDDIQDVLWSLFTTAEFQYIR
jgi:hypothetical protein